MNNFPVSHFPTCTFSAKATLGLQLVLHVGSSSDRFFPSYNSQAHSVAPEREIAGMNEQTHLQAFVNLWLYYLGLGKEQAFFQTNQSLFWLFAGLCWAFPLCYLGFYCTCTQERNFSFTDPPLPGNLWEGVRRDQLFPREVGKLVLPPYWELASFWQRTWLSPGSLEAVLS